MQLYVYGVQSFVRQISPVCLLSGTELSMFNHVYNNLMVNIFQAFQQRTSPIKHQLDQANELANQFHDFNVVLSHINVNRLEELNTR